MLGLTNLKFIHHKHYKGSIDEALDDKNTVGEFGSLCDLQIVFCRKFKHLNELMILGLCAYDFYHEFSVGDNHARTDALRCTEPQNNIFTSC